ncbi:MAG: hypothetical protein OJF59_002717 [Cytophagales bacterium]|jgi:hypothetical protein|nr:hypothetical protein [Bacteroidota bacterium]MBS1981653.1 hypothetical protein [Bacteroidota bacterium]WHZ08963.1 MAG: hypothetical protein OJF59_002717 [Cytophagales bacterium]
MRSLLFTIFVLLLLVSCKEHEVSPTKPISPSTPVQLPINLSGYTDKTSYYPGETVELYLSADNKADNCLIRIYNINHDSVSYFNTAIKPQPILNNDPWMNGFGYALTTTFTIPITFQSGVYLIENKFLLIVKSLHRPQIVIVFPLNTENAYCQSGGKSLYRPVGNKAQIISFLRPIPFPHENKNLNFLEKGLQFFHSQKDLNSGYITDIDLDDEHALDGAKLLIIPGHSEYWTLRARRNFDRYINKGNNALILSGNTMWWQVRYSSDQKQLICYKDISDPISDPLQKTINWVDPSLNYPTISSIGADYVHGGHGNIGWGGYKVITPMSPLLSGTGLRQDDILHIPTIEYDGIAILGYQNGYPIPDKKDFYKLEVIGFDETNYSGMANVAAFYALQKKINSGIIVNMGTTDWCSRHGVGGTDKDKVQRITRNAIGLLINSGNVFTK